MVSVVIFSRDSMCCNCLPYECCRVAEVSRVLNFLVPFTSLKIIHLHFNITVFGYTGICYHKLKIVDQWMDMVESSTRN